MDVSGARISMRRRHTYMEISPSALLRTINNEAPNSVKYSIIMMHHTDPR